MSHYIHTSDMNYYILFIFQQQLLFEMRLYTDLIGRIELRYFVLQLVSIIHGRWIIINDNIRKKRHYNKHNLIYVCVKKGMH